MIELENNVFNRIFGKLNIRAKLIWILIIPVLTLLYFSISGIYLKSLDYNRAKTSLEFISISIQLDNLVHELQKERGLSAGFVASKGNNGQQILQKQRAHTDAELKSFFQDITNNNKSKDYWSFFKIFSELELSLRALPVMRLKVDKLEGKDLFNEYSLLISTAINIVQHMLVIISNDELARQSNAFIILLSLQEYAGMERGQLNAVFTSDLFDAERFNDVNGYISAQKKSLAKFNTISTPQHKHLLKIQMDNPVMQEVEELRKAATYKASRNYRLIKLQSIIGYGGLIHDFKNYVIRGKFHYLEHFNKKYIEAKNIIVEYKKLPGMSKKEIALLDEINNTFFKYKSMLKVVRDLRRKGKEIVDIDAVVIIDDKPALDAIDFLNKSITGMDTSIWWDKASIRIQLIRNVSNRVRDDLSNFAQSNLLVVTKTLYLYIFLTSISLLVSFLLAFLLIRHLIGGIINIETHMSKMQENSEFDKLLSVNGEDEISKVAESFNNLIKERGAFDEQLKLAATVFNKASEAMLVTDADNKFIMVNPAFTEITGYALDDVMGKTPVIMKSGKQDEKFYSELWDGLHKNDCWSGEIINKRKNGEIFPEWLNINIIRNSQGKIINHIAMFSDITERKKYEEKQVLLQRQLLQSQKMESIGQLTGGIAHDFNNMLSSILGYTELAMGIDNDKEKLDDYLKEVSLAGNRAKELIIQMLSFSRDNNDVKFQLVNIDSLLKESISMIRPIIPSTIEFVPHISDGVMPIMANAVMINQVIMNLCINARDAIGEHGRIDFSLHMVSLNDETCSACYMPISGDFVEISIQDTGAGIDADKLSKLFDPFFSTKQMGNEKGTGMGLAMVHSILHDHNGHIIVESTEGKGSNFRLLFPLASDSGLVENNISNMTEDNEFSEIKSIDDVNACNILLVDDEESIILLMTEVLQNHGFAVTGYIDSEQALAHFKENKDKYDLVITDQTMPKLTGAELSKAIIEIQPDISIILCSGYSDTIDDEGTESIGIKAI